MYGVTKISLCLVSGLLLLTPELGATAIPAQSSVTIAPPPGTANPTAKAPALLAPDSLKPNDIDAFIAAVMKEWQVPGLAIAVIKDGQVVLSKGYGYRDVDQKLPVTPRTLFAIGSITKSFTVTAPGSVSESQKSDDFAFPYTRVEGVSPGRLPQHRRDGAGRLDQLERRGDDSLRPAPHR